MLLKAFSLIEDKNIKLYIVGGQAHIYSTSIKELCDNIPTDRIKWLGRITDSELKEILYERMLLYLSVSL